MKRLILGLGLVLACTTAYASDAEDFAKLTPQQALEQANQWYHSGKDVGVQVLPNAIVAHFASGEEVKVPTGDKAPISIAPYIHQSHPCAFHVATSCTGELKDTTLQVKVTDLETGKVLQQGAVTTGANGFVDFWMPKNKQQLQFTFSYMGKSVTQVLSTGPKDRTCVTDMQLKQS